MKVISQYLLLLSLIFGMIACSRNTPVAGTDTETGGTKVSGIILSANKLPVARVRAMLIPATYNPLQDGAIPDSLVDTTDIEGRYTFAAKAGKYNLAADLDSSNIRLFIPDLIIMGKNFVIKADTLTRPGTINVTLPDSLGSLGGFVFLTGTTIKKIVPIGETKIILDSVPQAIYPELKFSNIAGNKIVTLLNNVPVDPPDTLAVAR